MASCCSCLGTGEQIDSTALTRVPGDTRCWSIPFLSGEDESPEPLEWPQSVFWLFFLGVVGLMNGSSPSSFWVSDLSSDETSQTMLVPVLFEGHDFPQWSPVLTQALLPAE